MNTNERKLVFYGAGSMAEALVRGLLDRKLYAPEQIGMLNRSNAERLAELQGRYGIAVPAADADKRRLLLEADVIVLAMKPKDAAAAIRGLGSLLGDRSPLIVSVIAGLSIATIETLFGRKLPVVRTMPNTSSTIGLGATGISYSDTVTRQHKEVAEALFRSVGMTAVVDESLIGAVNGISGSGPAYVYYMMEAMAETGEALGLSREASLALTVQTVLGAASMVRETGEAPAELRRKVTSPGGTTQAAIETFDAHGFKEAVDAAIRRCVERAGELGAAIERSASES